MSRKLRRVDLQARVAELKRRIAEARDLDEVDLYFHSQLVEYAPFRDAGHRAPNPKLIGLMRMTAKIRGISTRVIAANMTHVPKYSLWHGWVTFEGGVIAIAVYFEGDPRGYCSLASLETGAVDLFRFSVPEEPWSQEFEPDNAELVSFSRRHVESELN